MTTTGNSSGNWRGGSDRRKRNAWSNIRHELGGFTIAEFAAEGTWLGVAALTTAVPDSVMNNASKFVGHVAIEPILDPLEKVMTKICKLEECKVDPNLPREKRAENLARALIVFTPALAASWVVKAVVRHKLQPKSLRKEDHILSPSAKMIFATDELTQLGAMYVLNNQLAPASDEMIRGITSMSQKTFGISEQRAHDFASTVVIWAVPNAIGAAGAAAAIMGKHLKGWPETNPALKKIFDWGGNSPKK